MGSHLPANETLTLQSLMLSNSIISTSIIAYILATLFMLRSLRNPQGKPASNSSTSLIFAVIGLVSHALYLYIRTLDANGMDFSLSSMTVLVSAILVFIFLLGCLGLEIKRLGVLVFPLTALSLIFSLLWSGNETQLSEQSLLPLSAFSSHVLIAILAYSLITIATIQALLYSYQEKQFKKRTAPGMLASLPPLQTMEKLLFRLTLMGFILLTLTLLSGAMFSKQIFDIPFEFSHHVVLAVLGWIVFATILVKRISTGLRGSQAAVWTVAGFILIQLGYFGTKIISESLNL